MIRSVIAIGIVPALLFGAACKSTSSSVNPADYSTAYKLAVIDGDSREEADFQRAIDCIMATGIKGAGTEEKVGDTLYASWQQSSKQDSLLEWAQALCHG